MSLSPLAICRSVAHRCGGGGGGELRCPRLKRAHRGLARASRASMDAPPQISYISQADASAIDEALMSPSLGFSIDQLMELAGLSVATAIFSVFPPATHQRVLILAGPGNNGGDGLVCARHLHHFGYRQIDICLPKATPKPLYEGLVTQCQSLGIAFLPVGAVLRDPSAAPSPVPSPVPPGAAQEPPQGVSEGVSVGQSQIAPLSDRWDLVVDALFGFSFRGAPRAPFDALLAALAPPARPPPIASVDIPSGWDVEKGDLTGEGIRPDLLVSLTAPKLCARRLRRGTQHWLGGRFVPPAVRDRFGLRLPPYPGAAQAVALPLPQGDD